MKHYIFTITYSNGTEFKKQINAYDTITAWRKFTSWMQGFEYGTDNSIAINVAMEIQED